MNPGEEPNAPLVTLQELSEQTGIRSRTIRLWIAEGLLEPAARRGRDAGYSRQHASDIRRIRQLQAAGHTLLAIRGLLRKHGTQAAAATTAAVPADSPAGSWQHFELAPGIVVMAHGAPAILRLRTKIKSLRETFEEEENG